MDTNQSQTSKSGCSTTVKILGAITAFITAIATLVAAVDHFSSTSTTPASASDSNQNIATSIPTDQATPNSTWKVIINSSNTDITYNGYTNQSGYVLLIIDASFENDANSSQVLSGQLFDLQDSSGQHYQESQASDPSKTFAVDVGQSTETITTFEIPDSQCNYELSFIAGSSIASQWTITTC